MRILSLTRDYPRAISLRSHHDLMYACLNPPESAIDGIKLPSGRFAIEQWLAQLPSEWQQPDCVHISSSLGIFTQPPVIPIGLSRLNCPTVMKLSDSHFRHRPIQSLIEYAQEVGCQYHWTAYDRHHLHFFREAGLSNPFWMPGAFSIAPYEPTIAPQKRYDVLFCGNNSPTDHARRAKLLATLETAGVDLTVARKSYTDSLDAYTAAHIVFNCSLNGDLNRRVYEVLMAGGFLLTDRLAAESGLTQMFQEGVHLECYGSEQELLEKVQYYLAHPDRAAQIARQGQALFMQSYYPHDLDEQFLNIVVKGQPIPALCLATDDDRTHRPIQSYTSEALRDRIRIYELIHELHRCNDRLTLLAPEGDYTETLKDLRDLPRLEIVQPPQLAAIALLNCPSTKPQLQTALDQLQAQLQPNGIVLILGRTARRWDATIRALGWKPIQLQESGEGACRVYQNPRIVADETIEPLNLPIKKPLSLPNRLVFTAKVTARKLFSSLSVHSA
ncbi:hypothetical protein LEP3755_19340 [Leptolyngbya sp. NIES-3755]|nr:hypothetical protein LEP3755_19340 [Leptolyngbya sp. NIES-3755]